MMVVKIKNQKGTEKCVIKRIKFENSKNCFEATQLENKINHLEKKIDIDRFEKGRKKFIKSSKLLLKTRRGFKSKTHNVSTEKINKVILTRLHLEQSVSKKRKKALVRKKEEINCNNIIKQYKND